MVIFILYAKINLSAILILRILIDAKVKQFVRGDKSFFFIEKIVKREIVCKVGTLKHASDHKMVNHTLRIFNVCLIIFWTLGAAGVCCIPVANSELCQKSKMERFFENIEQLKIVDYFRKTLYLRYLKGFSIVSAYL